MKKSNPMVVFAVLAGAVLVLGVAAFSFLGGKKQSATPQATAPTVNPVDEAAKAKAMREHMELTQRSLAKLKEAEPAPAKPTAAAEPEAEPAKPEPETATPAAQAPARTARAPVAAPRPRAAPKPASAPVSKKKMESLDDLGKGIASELGQ
jgi:hypothetical protein